MRHNCTGGSRNLILLANHGFDYYNEEFEEPQIVRYFKTMYNMLLTEVQYVKPEHGFGLKPWYRRACVLESIIPDPLQRLSTPSKGPGMIMHGPAILGTPKLRVRKKDLASKKKCLRIPVLIRPPRPFQ